MLARIPVYGHLAEAPFLVATCIEKSPNFPFSRNNLSVFMRGGDRASTEEPLA